MMKIILAFLLSFSALADDAYDIVIYTDADAKARAEEFKSYLITKPPFSKLDNRLKVSIVELSADLMNCRNDLPEAPRLIHCNTEELLKLKSKDRANLVMVFTSRGSGGSGGTIPIASKDYPIQTMFHEMLHTFGLDDEYDYSESEKKVYCDPLVSAPNVVYFKDKPPYTDDPSARKTHSKDVPWMGDIRPEDLIVSGTDLGSADVRANPGEAKLGLYRGGSCNGTKEIPGWRPYRNSIMRDYHDDTIYPFYEKIILKNIQSALGRKVKLDIEIPAPPPRCLEHNHEIEKFKGLQQEMRDILEYK